MDTSSEQVVSHEQHDLGAMRLLAGTLADKLGGVERREGDESLRLACALARNVVDLLDAEMAR